jgi:hypothetical protein
LKHRSSFFRTNLQHFIFETHQILRTVWLVLVRQKQKKIILVSWISRQSFIFLSFFSNWFQSRYQVIVSHRNEEDHKLLLLISIMSSCYNIEQFSSVGLLWTTYQNDPQICHERITLKSTKIFTYSDNQMRQIIYNGLEDCNCNTIGGTSFSWTWEQILSDHIYIQSGREIMEGEDHVLKPMDI